LILQAKVIADNVKNIVSNNAGIISYLNCENGKKVSKNTLIATITPDWSDANIKSLLSQKNSLQTQTDNIKNIIFSTKKSFNSQLNSLQIQKTNLETQISILQQNLQELEEQKKYWVSDLNTQLKTLKTQLEDLEKSKRKLEQSKDADLSKLQLNIFNIKTQIKSLVWSVLLKIDEIYWITDKNKHRNDSFENYLSAKNYSLKEQIKGEFRQLYQMVLDKKFDQMTNDEVSEYLKQVDELVQKVKDSIKASVTAITLSQTIIDTWYAIFVEYDSSLINIKNNFDNLLKSLESVKNNYDNQIISIQTQINIIKNNIENIQSNKLGSYTSTIDIQINQIQSQLDNAKYTLQNVLSQINSLKDQEDIQIKQLENQLNQLQSSINTIKIKLSWEKLYSEIDWKVKAKKVSSWNKVWPWTLICQIIPNKTSLKLQIYSPIKLNDYQNVVIRWYQEVLSWVDLKIISKLSYKDPITQNYIYETNSLPEWVLSEGQTLTVEVRNIKWDIKNWNIKIPLEFVINKLTGQKVKVKDKSWRIKEKKIILWNIDWNYIEVISGLNIEDMVCR